jgi:hydroxymethylbilane synthase
MIELVVGSRGSRLALLQTRSVVERLERLRPDVRCRIQVIKTKGDMVQSAPLATIGGKGLFVKEIEQAILADEIDFAVHSAKDLPSDTDERLCFVAYTEREDPADVLVSRFGRLNELPSGAVVGTSSTRRRAQLLHARPDVRVVDLRGNLDTRLRRLEEGKYDAVVVAYAGLWRMGLQSRITEILGFDVCLPAAGQGALAVQCKSNNRVADLLQMLDHPQTRRCVTAERALLGHLGAGCQTPVAVLGRETSGIIDLEAAVFGLDGSRLVRMSESGSATNPAEIGIRLAQKMMEDPLTEELLEEARTGAERKDIGAT